MVKAISLGVPGSQPLQDMMGETATRIREFTPADVGRFNGLAGGFDECASGIWRRSPEGPLSTGVGGASSTARVGSRGVPPSLKSEDGRRSLCLQLAMCNSEYDVMLVLKQEGIWDNPDMWTYYGNIESHFGIIGGQQDRPEAALIEKVVNAIDAVLVGECLRRGLHPEGSGAPRSIKAAVRDFFGIRSGEIGNLTPDERRELAENISLIATGLKTNPCYTIVDRGEGQTPAMMPKTLLSLARGNKLRIPFVQGQFNQGGTGAFQFCGEHNVQLIISRRHPEICNQRGDDDSWGFTIVRRFDPEGNARNSTYRFLSIGSKNGKGGKVLTFSGATPLPILPGDYPEAHGQHMTHGTFVKLFDYHVGARLRTNAARDLASRLSTMLPGAALPVRILERRNGYDDRTEATLSGLAVRLREDMNNIVEDGFPASATIRVNGHQLGVSIYAFKQAVAKDYVDGEGVIFTVNGQTQGHLPRSFFSRRAVGMGYLAESLLVIVDSTKISGRAREDLFMTSRDRVRQGPLRTEIVRELETLISKHPGLKKLRVERRRAQVQDKLEGDEPLADVLRDIVFKTPTLAQLFVQGSRISNPLALGQTAAQDEFVGNKFPNIFVLAKSFPQKSPKLVSPGGRFTVAFKTDADNDYFSRSSGRNPGRFTLRVNGEEVDSHSMQLWNGVAILTVHVPESVRVGSRLAYEYEVTDAFRSEPFSGTFNVKVVDADSIGSPKGHKKQKREKKHSTGEPGQGAVGPSKFQLPYVEEVHQDQWRAHGFDERSIMRVVHTGEGYDFFINMDNVYLAAELKSNTTIDPQLLRARFKYAMTLAAMGAIKRYEEEQEREGSNDERDVTAYVTDVVQSFAPIVLPMIDHLGGLVLPGEE